MMWLLAYAPNPPLMDVTLVLGLAGLVFVTFYMAGKEVSDEQVAASRRRSAERRSRSASQ